jgi:hypothetical protein
MRRGKTRTLAVMDTAARERLVAAYIQRFTREYVWDRDTVLQVIKGEREDNFWAFQAFDDISRSDPELCWELILQTLHTPHTDSVKEILAAGPLEDLLARFGPQFIDRVEAKVKEDPEFKDLLGGVWRNSMTEELWARVQACRGEPW